VCVCVCVCVLVSVTTGRGQDTGTNNAYTEGHTPFSRVAGAVHTVGADGFNGDQMYGVPAGFLAAARSASAKAMVLEPEICFNNSATGVGIDAMTWSGAYLFANQQAPLTLSFKTLEPRHMVHVLHRDGKDRMRAVQTSWFNGAGIHTWENVFGIWNGLTPRVSAATKAVATLLRGLKALVQGNGITWNPHTPVTLVPKLYASEFSNATHRLWALVNTDNETDATGSTVAIPCQPGTQHDKSLWFDMWRGTTLPTPPCKSFVAIFSVSVEKDGFGALLCLPATAAGAPAATAAIAASTALARVVHPLTLRPLASFNGSWAWLRQQIAPNPPTPAMSAAQAAQLGMVEVSPPHGAAAFNFSVGALGVSLGEQKKLPEAVDVQYPWESHPTASHAPHPIVFEHSFYISKYPVTNVQFAKFLRESRWQPATHRRQNWLRHWIKRPGRVPEVPKGQGNRPMVMVSRDDAAAFCAHYRARLPREWEWQYAAQGSDGRAWPWGPGDDNSTTGFTHRANVSHETVMPLPPAVDAHPTGASPFGVESMVASVHEWTDQYSDAHMTRAVLRGGSHWSPVPQPAVMYEYFFNRTSNIGYTDGAPNWYFP
jgi:iron(II)-dependent oxidoreductase